MPPDLYAILHFIQLTVNKYDAGQQLHKCSFVPIVKILGQKKKLCMSNYFSTLISVVILNQALNGLMILAIYTAT